MGLKVHEPARELPVVATAEVVVLGGGPAGVAAATAAARAGADTLLIERYGCLGGLSTGGLVIILLCYGKRGEMLMSGLPVEFRDRLYARDAARVRDYDRYENPVADPEVLKHVCLELVIEAKARLLLHAWAVGAIVKDDRMDAVILESKSGRQAVRGQVFLDCSGDGDTAAWCDVPHENTVSQIGIGLIWRWGNVDYPRFQAFGKEQPERLDALRKAARELDCDWPAKADYRSDRAWLGHNLPGDALNVEDLTRCELECRLKAMRTYDYFKANVPGFEAVSILDTASQVGTRESRRIVGETTITGADTPGGRFEDTVGTGVTWFGRQCGEPFDLPYRAMVPQRINNLLYAGRCLSADHEAHQQTRVINTCWVAGQGAGVAAALAVRQGQAFRDLAIADLQAELRQQGVQV